MHGRLFFLCFQSPGNRKSIFLNTGKLDDSRLLFCLILLSTSRILLLFQIKQHHFFLMISLLRHSRNSYLHSALCILICQLIFRKYKCIVDYFPCIILFEMYCLRIYNCCFFSILCLKYTRKTASFLDAFTHQTSSFLLYSFDFISCKQLIRRICFVCFIYSIHNSFSSLF